MASSCRVRRKVSNLCYSDQYAHRWWYQALTFGLAILLIMTPLFYVLILTADHTAKADVNCPLNKTKATTENPVGPFQGIIQAPAPFKHWDLDRSPGIPIPHLESRQFESPHQHAS